MRSANILTHGYCFDGLVSASLFCAWLGERGVKAKPKFRTCGYSPKLKTLPSDWFNAETNALLDFRYANHPKLTHYIDHHATAFKDEAEEREAIASGARGERLVYFDPLAPSCAGLVVKAAQREGVDLGRASLVALANQVDSASFTTAEEPFFAKTAGLMLADVAERFADTDFVTRIAPLLVARSVEELMAMPELAERSREVTEGKDRFLEAVRAAGRLQGDVAVVDLSVSRARSAGKFATYLAFPRCRYSVILLQTREQLKLGVGFNPFGDFERTHDIGALCRTFGGGGHRAVGAVNFPNGELDRAREVMAVVAKTLAS